MLYYSVIALLVLLKASTSLAAEDYAYVSRHLGARSPYNHGSALKEDPIVADYDINQIQLFVRHGVRFPNQDDIKDINEIVKVLKTSTNPQVVEWAHAFTPSDFPLDKADELTDMGREDLHQIGLRMGKKYSAFRAGLDLGKSGGVRNIASNVGRSIGSGESFSAGFWDQSGQTPAALTIIPKEQDVTIDILENCPNYDKAVGHQPKVEMNRYIDATYGPLRERLSEVLGLPSLTNKDVYKVWYACAYSASIFRDVSTFCSVLTKDDFEANEYAIDIKYSYKYAYNSEAITSGMACQLFKEMIADLKNASHVQMVVKHGHSMTVLPLETKLGIHRDPFALTADATPQQIANRSFRTSEDDMYGANLMLQLLTKKGTSKRYVRALLSEVPVVIPGCTDELCEYDHFMDVVAPLLACDFDKICKA
ncbi:histidine phosphatase superfamily [Dichotomocladium elegans]|nr:histidine phosphatase superfamily [Dichotomocladium elegans]